MINRQNWLEIRMYLRYIEVNRQNAPATVIRSRGHLRNLLEWADDVSLGHCDKISPGFPSYLVNRNLSPSSVKKGLETARHFFLYARSHWLGRYRQITPAWIDLLQPPRNYSMESRLVTHEFYTFDEIQKIAAARTETLRQERGKMAAVFLFLSGMRADAFASLPISCVSLEDREVRQLPELGVRTKNHKAAITFLFDIPELLQVLFQWKSHVDQLDPEMLWFSPLTRDGMTLMPEAVAFDGRGDVIGRDLKIICEMAGVNYLSPHKLRHGHVVYALKQAKTMSELKAISQNVMHSSVVITDQIYGNLVRDDVRDIIGSLGKNIQPATDDRLDEILKLLRSSRVST